jgi:hypothetical protein
VASQHSAGWVLGSWRELGRVLRGSVAAGEDSRPGKEAAVSCRGRGGLLLSVKVRNPRTEVRSAGCLVENLELVLARSRTLLNGL